MVVAECMPGATGCVEFTYTYGPINHELRHCIDRTISNSSMVSPRDLIPIAAFDDEVYVKGCLKGLSAMILIYLPNLPLRRAKKMGLFC